MKELLSLEKLHKSPLIQNPGDKVVQEMMPCGDIVTRINTSNLNATHRQYMRKDGKLASCIIQA